VNPDEWLDQWITRRRQAAAPEGFADRVMARVRRPVAAPGRAVRPAPVPPAGALWLKCLRAAAVLGAVALWASRVFSIVSSIATLR
jgi:hypothetical protein